MERGGGRCWVPAPRREDPRDVRPNSGLMLSGSFVAYRLQACALTPHIKNLNFFSEVNFYHSSLVFGFYTPCSLIYFVIYNLLTVTVRNPERNCQDSYPLVIPQAGPNTI